VEEHLRAEEDRPAAAEVVAGARDGGAAEGLRGEGGAPEGGDLDEVVGALGPEDVGVVGGHGDGVCGGGRVERGDEVGFDLADAGERVGVRGDGAGTDVKGAPARGRQAHRR